MGFIRTKKSSGKDKQMISRLNEKDKDAFIDAYDLYVDQIYRFIYFKVSDQDEAQDLTSSVFLKSWNYLQTNSLTDVKTLKALIYKIARTTVIDYYRQKTETVKIDSLNSEGEESKIELIDEKQDIKKQFEISSQFSELEKKIAELKDEYKEIIILKYIDELSISEIADILDKSKGNIRVLQHRALKALKDLTEEK